MEYTTYSILSHILSENAFDTTGPAHAPGLTLASLAYMISTTFESWSACKFSCMIERAAVDLKE